MTIINHITVIIIRWGSKKIFLKWWIECSCNCSKEWKEETKVRKAWKTLCLDEMYDALPSLQANNKFPLSRKFSDGKRRGKEGYKIYIMFVRRREGRWWMDERMELCLDKIFYLSPSTSNHLNEDILWKASNSIINHQSSPWMHCRLFLNYDLEYNK